ncbi:hypothetical protein ABT214_18505 [Micromonospora purpureochromogenes]|uniref:coiled-coil domain-containing protein n=1 Tax=Micromonospora purpureochromogenes TaxID=47872 RepID=UPI0033230B0B
MIDRGSGRTTGLTDWQLMDVLSMWACVQDHETQGHWKQVAGWRKVCDLAMNHLRRLHEYRRGLAEAWPPETNAAARAYLAELDQLIDRVQHTHDAAAANHDALAAATRAIDSARPDLKNLYEQYSTKLQQKRSYEATLADPKAAAGSRVVDPPVTDVELEQLNTKARGIMYGLSGELQQAQVMLQKPPAARPNPRLEETGADAYSSVGAAPVVPPIVPVPIATSQPTRPATSLQPVAAPSAPSMGPVLGAGPVLGGAAAGLAPSPGSTSLPGASSLTTSASPSGHSIGMPPALPPASGRLPNPSIRGGLAPNGGANGQPHMNPPRPIAPGGLIGGVPGMSLGPPPGNTPPRRVNPIGGVIGGGGAGTSPTGAAGSRPGNGRAANLMGSHGIPPIGGSPGMSNEPGFHKSSGHSGRHLSKDEARRWDPDHPWETDEGVTPVVRPPDDDGPIDPGPAIGFHR